MSRTACAALSSPRHTVLHVYVCLIKMKFSFASCPRICTVERLPNATVKTMPQFTFLGLHKQSQPGWLSWIPWVGVGVGVRGYCGNPTKPKTLCLTNTLLTIQVELSYIFNAHLIHFAHFDLDRSCTTHFLLL